MSVFFITGAGPHIGKTYATGYLGKMLFEHGVNVITQKLVQTGCDEDVATDIRVHRRMMQMPLQLVDKVSESCPFVFPFPASPYLASNLQDVSIHPRRLAVATKQLQLQHELVLLEIEGGIMSPLNESVLTIDYMASQGHPVIVVTSGQPESIDQTLLVIDALTQRGLSLHAMIYNQWHDVSVEFTEQTLEDEEQYKLAFDEHDTGTKIAKHTRRFLQHYLTEHHPDAYWVEMPQVCEYGLDPIYKQWDSFETPQASGLTAKNKDKQSSMQSGLSVSVESYAQKIADTVLYNGRPYRE
ncbi:dethiobiotin synthase [Psychrobacter sp. FDAARGOS_221]|uniref:dethiobiotin synthase n=1 Tax=Psychrobacter sp. FDAARGOS_221 TaxID=1975705 RepID=UPI000BB5391A|nr:dethiobiotin synthase [Psychrobacter sp. FDAARGOS_221]PNK59611.1 dethiobiotin synthase [Psychrobacter sp. FDAARGOS_221]